MSMKTASIIQTNDEILCDKKCDCVSQYLIQELNALQYTVSKLTILPNAESAIINELHSLIKSSDVIIAVSAKWGPFFRAIGRMISQELAQNEDLATVLKKRGEFFDSDDVFLPTQAKIIEGNAHPVVHFQRVFIMSERHAKQSFANILKNHLWEYRKTSNFRKTIRVSQNGNAIEDLSELKKVLSNNKVEVDFSKDEQCSVFKVSSSDFVDIVEFEEKVKERFEAYRLKLWDDSDVWGRVYGSHEKHVKNAIENIERCLEQYGPDNTFISFNGGKDCTVLLHLLLTVLKQKYPNYSEPVFCLYVQSDKPFLEQDEFIAQAKTFYNLKISTIRSGIKDALQQTLENFPNYRACFMGTRRTDPYSGDLNVFQMTDSNWPPIMRVSPLLDWHYSDIWDYLLYYKVPYCKLYDMGFTSLGNTVNTRKNPSLIYVDRVEGREVYLPAYKLLKENKERRGRNAS